MTLTFQDLQEKKVLGCLEYPAFSVNPRGAVRQFQTLSRAYWSLFHVSPTCIVLMQ